ncbi:Hypothetical protein AA314_01906 [Archangium gephyra]|uniref:Uncharacterized protein n=1 Tax=Archangium gephyra TaxID=48 RepID=A0AAC8Q373_9BACT|nr:Hypothetical protein AA314_01906 [Archangium gephyra]
MRPPTGPQRPVWRLSRRELHAECGRDVPGGSPERVAPGHLGHAHGEAARRPTQDARPPEPSLFLEAHVPHVHASRRRAGARRADVARVLPRRSRPWRVVGAPLGSMDGPLLQVGLSPAFPGARGVGVEGTSRPATGAPRPPARWSAPTCHGRRPAAAVRSR